MKYASTSMLTDDIKKKIRQITIHTKRTLRGMLIGDTRSAQKGVGFEFDQLREYQVGDDVRCIDWNATSRTGSLLVKQYIEERSRTIFLAVDVSASSHFGSSVHTKKDRWNEIASILALVAGRGNDLIGLILFTDEVELYIPPRRGTAHVMTIIEHIFTYIPQRKKSSYMAVFSYLLKQRKKHALVFIVSDFIVQCEAEKQSSAPIKVIAATCDVVAVRYLDQREKRFVDVGVIELEDIETGHCISVDTQYLSPLWYEHRIAEQNRLFKKWRCGVIDLVDNRCMASDIVLFFKRRMQY